MTKKELQRRLDTMTPELIARVRSMIDQGFGALGISQNAPVTVKQANAVFQLVKNERGNTVPTFASTDGKPFAMLGRK